MQPSSIGGRLAGVGAATILIAGLFAQAAPILAAGQPPASPSSASATQASHPHAVTPASRSDASRLAGRGSINVRALPTKPALPFSAKAVNAALEKVQPVHPKGAAPAAKPAVVAPPDPVLATSSGHPSASTPVAVPGQTEGGSGGAEPADSGMAVGPDGTIQAVNLQFLFTDRAGTTVGTVSMPDFFELPEESTGSQFNTFDSAPRIQFDTLRQRWIATEVSWDCSTGYQLSGQAAPQFGHGYLDFAISRTADPLGTWDVSYFSATDAFPAVPTFGSTTDKLGLVATYTSMGAGGNDTNPGCLGSDVLESHMFVMDWSQLGPAYNPGKVQESGFTFDGIPGVRLAVQEPVNLPELRFALLLDDTIDGGSTTDVIYGSIAGSAAKHTLATTAYNLSMDGLVARFMNPPSPLQSGGGSLTDAIDGTPDSVVEQNATLAFTSNYPCTPSGDSSQRVCVRVVTLDAPSGTGEPSEIGDSLIGTNTYDDSFGGIAFSGSGVLHVVYSRSSASSNAGSYERYNLPTDSPSQWSTAALLTAGAGAYDGTLWGSYLGVSSDPIDPSSVWVGDTFANSSHEWSTTIHQISTSAGGAQYTPMTPVRVLDTRSAVGLSGSFASGTPRTFTVAGTNGIPADAVAVTGNLTVTGQTSAGYVSLGPVSSASPSSSTLNFPAGDNRANNVTLALSSSGGLSAVFKGAAGAHTNLILDVTGYFEVGTGDTYNPVSPSRILDSRFGTGVATSFVPNTPQSFPVRNVTVGAVTIPSDATAITANLTVTGQTHSGYVSLTPTPTATPATSTINFPAGDVRANGLTIPIGADGSVSAVFKSVGGKVDLILDVTGYYTPSGGLLYYPLNPGRRIDTRGPLGHAGLGNGLSGLQSTTPRDVAVAGHDGVPADAVAVTGNLTVTGQTAAGYVSLTDVSTALPATSTINFPLGDTRANGITAPLGTGGDAGELWFVYRSAGGKGSQLILDLTGYFK
jgi:hypothetical protein